MNDIYIFSILCFGALFIVLQYSKHTTEKAISTRWELSEYMHDVLEDDKYSDDYKEYVAYLFHISLNNNIFPKLIFSTIYTYFFKRKEYLLYKSTYKEVGRENENSKKVFNLFLKVNFFNSPHWYILFGLVFSSILLVYFIFSKIKNTFDIKGFEAVLFRDGVKTSHV
jgi:hypothetical protein